MKVAVISDVHSNPEALNEVLKAVEREGVEKILCLGDLVGYGPDPNRVVDRVRGLDSLTCVKGNHDEAVLRGSGAGMNPAAARAVRWTVDEAEEETMRFLGGLEAKRKISAGGKSVFMVHGSPRDPLREYVYGDAAESLFERFLAETGCEILLMGHTHVPYVRRFSGKVVANPGAVGQPRDGNPRASFALLDTEKMEVEIRRVEYEIDPVAQRMRKAGLPGGLAGRLYRGR